jgi:hypothetical protein
MAKPRVRLGEPSSRDRDDFCLRTSPRLCAAIVDRLTFNATIIETGTQSYRLARQGRRGASQPPEAAAMAASLEPRSDYDTYDLIDDAVADLVRCETRLSPPSP